MTIDEAFVFNNSKLAGLEQYLATLADSHGKPETAAALCHAAARLLPETRGELLLTPPDHDGWLRAGWWTGGVATPLQPAEPIPEDERGEETTTYLPLVALGQSVGEIRIVSNEGLPLTERHTVLARIIASAGATALAGQALQHRLRQRNVRDPLTGLFNARYLEDTLERELHRARRVGEELVLIRLEVDGFRQFIERYGAGTADRLLQIFAEVLNRSFRGSDVCCRVGESTFVILLAGARLDGGAERAEVVRSTLGAQRVRRGGAPLSPVALSAGVASYPAHGDSRDMLMEAAAGALAMAQDTGGDATRIAEQASLPADELSSTRTPDENNA